MAPRLTIGHGVHHTAARQRLFFLPINTVRLLPRQTDLDLSVSHRGELARDEESNPLLCMRMEPPIEYAHLRQGASIESVPSMLPPTTMSFVQQSRDEARPIFCPSLELTLLQLLSSGHWSLSFGSTRLSRGGGGPRSGAVGWAQRNGPPFCGVDGWAHPAEP